MQLHTFLASYAALISADTVYSCVLVYALCIVVAHVGRVGSTHALDVLVRGLHNPPPILALACGPQQRSDCGLARSSATQCYPARSSAIQRSAIQRDLERSRAIVSSQVVRTNFNRWCCSAFHTWDPHWRVCGLAESEVSGRSKAIA